MKLEERSAGHGVLDESLVPEGGGEDGAEAFGRRGADSESGRLLVAAGRRGARRRRAAGRRARPPRSVTPRRSLLARQFRRVALLWLWLLLRRRRRRSRHVRTDRRGQHSEGRLAGVRTGLRAGLADGFAVRLPSTVRRRHGRAQTATALRRRQLRRRAGALGRRRRVRRSRARRLGRHGRPPARARTRWRRRVAVGAALADDAHQIAHRHALQLWRNAPVGRTAKANLNWRYWKLK